jgi:hypothetical protein
MRGQYGPPHIMFKGNPDAFNSFRALGHIFRRNNKDKMKRIMLTLYSYGRSIGLKRRSTAEITALRDAPLRSIENKKDDENDVLFYRSWTIIARAYE